METFTRFGTLNSTHVDAPWHYNSQIQGERAATIDELPLAWFFSDDVVLDMAAKEGDIERLMQLDQLPPYGFKFSCFPLNIIGGSAGPARVVALV